LPEFPVVPPLANSVPTLAMSALVPEAAAPSPEDEPPPQAVSSKSMESMEMRARKGRCRASGLLDNIVLLSLDFRLGGGLAVRTCRREIVPLRNKRIRLAGRSREDSGVSDICQFQFSLQSALLITLRNSLQCIWPWGPGRRRA
jgi:hypothetical protein